MKRFTGLLVATIALSIPLSGAAGASTTPADYQPGCESAYQGGKALFDPLIANAKPATSAIEKGFCGENRHS